MFQSLRQRSERRATIDRLYGAIVAQARAPAFYGDSGVPDTVAGRLEMMVLHVHLVNRRLAGEGEEARAVNQDLFDRFCDDMDASLRALGVGDLAVPRKMRAIGEAFYGRAQAYDAALAQSDDAALIAALHRNVLSGKVGTEAAAEMLARYVRHADRALAALDLQAILRSDFSLAAPLEA
jgi:cytochrome b pre-mRNA-processing protein 3